MASGIINVDWLELSCLLNDETTLYNSDLQIGKLNLKLSDFGSRYYSRLHEIYYNGQHVAKISSCPRSEILKDNSVLLQYENHVFYSGQLREIHEEIFKSLGLELQSVTRIDVCNDWNLPREKFQEFTLKFAGGEIDNVLSTHALAVRYDRIEGKGNRIATTFNIGSKKSDKYAKIYFKTLEIQVSGKDYITEYHRLNGLDIQKDIFRAEVTSKGKLNKKIGHHKVLKAALAGGGALKNLWYSLTYKYLKFTYVTGKSRKDREEIYELVPQPSINRVLYTPVYKKAQKGSLREKKSLMKKLIRYWYNYDNSDYLESAKFLIEKNPILRDYLKKKADQYQKDFFAESPHLKPINLKQIIYESRTKKQVGRTNVLSGYGNSKQMELLPMAQ